MVYRPLEVSLFFSHDISNGKMNNLSKSCLRSIYTHTNFSARIRVHKHLIEKLSRGLRQESVGIGPLARDGLSPHETKGMRHDEGVVLRQSRKLFKYVHIVDGNT